MVTHRRSLVFFEGVQRSEIMQKENKTFFCLIFAIRLESSRGTRSKWSYFIEQEKNYGSCYSCWETTNYDILSSNCSLKKKYYYEILICYFIELIIKRIFSYPVNIRCEFHKDRWVSFDATIDAKWCDSIQVWTIVIYAHKGTSIICAACLAWVHS